MSAIWNTYRIEDIADKITIGPFGSRMKSDTYVESGVPVIRGTNLTGSKKFSGDWVFITEKLAKQLENCCVSNGDLVFPHRGSIGEVGLVDNQFPQYMMSSSLMKLRCNPNIADSEFIYYFFKSHQGRYELLKNASQVGTPGIGQPLTSLKNIEIKLPSLREQRKIVKILSDLDEKIHLNNQINQTLESIAQALFKSWFIDFDPVRAKIAAKQEGKDPELAAMCVISGKSEAELRQMAKEDFAELQATAALFPDELVESELGGVPKGWEISKISKIGKVITGKTPSSKIENSFAEKGTFFITPTDIDTEVFVTNTNRYLSEYGEIAIKNSKVDEGSLCITCIGSQMGKVVITPKSAFTNQQINSILLFNSTLRNYIFLNLRQRRDEIFLIGSGGSTMPIINKSTFESLNLILPDLALIRKFDNFISPFFNNILSNSVENIELKNIRDALLPELLAGKINVSMLKDM